MVGWGLKAFIVIALLCVLMVQMITATALMEEIHKLRGEVGMLWENQKKILLKQLDTIKTTGNIQNEQLKVVLEQLVAKIEQEKDVSECYEKIEEITQLTLDHAQAVVEENERLKKENTVLATAVIGREKLLALKNTSRKKTLTSNRKRESAREYKNKKKGAVPRMGNSNSGTLRI